MLQPVNVPPATLRYLTTLMQTATLDIEKLPGTNGTLVTKLTGKLSLETVHNFIQLMRPEPAERLVIDMNGVSFLDSAGVGALVSLFVNRRNTGKTFALASLNQQGSAILQVAGLTKLLPIFPTVDAAVE